jgi:hypothetical protein
MHVEIALHELFGFLLENATHVTLEVFNRNVVELVGTL